MTIERRFLGWDAPALPRAAAELRKHFGDDFDGVLIALPGGRAARRLEELLIERCAPAWIPPRIGTIGPITDALVRFLRPRAGGFARELAWIEALRAAPADDLDAITKHRPEAEDFAAWAALATHVRALHQELAAERRTFAEVAACDALPASERARWRTLAALQRDYLARIEAAGLCDPHADRLLALAEDRLLRAVGQLVLVGTASVNQLQEELIRRAAAQGVQVIALILAPESEADAFDDLGLLRAEAWKDRAAPLDDAIWRVADRPADQAEEAVAFLRAACGGPPDARATVAVLHEEVAPFLARRLALDGPGLRPPVGRELSATAPGRLLDVLASWLQSRSPRTFAALVRHPDLMHALGVGECGAACDEYIARHLPARLDDAWPECAEGEMPWFVARLRQAMRALLGLAGALTGRGPRALVAWSHEVAGFLAGVFAAGTSRETDDALERFAVALDEIAQLSPELGGVAVPAAEFLRLLLHAEGKTPLAPDPTQKGLEQLGWLELPLDEAPALCVAGFQLGAVPEAIHGHPFLPEKLRVALGLPSNDDRLARDIYALHAIVRSRERALFISGRRGTAGDPWLPSPLVFRKGDETARVRAFFREPEPRQAASGGTTTAWAPAVPPEPQPVVVESFSASALNLYRKSPRLYWLQRVLGLATVEAEPHELDPLGFGSLAHAVLQRFHQAPHCAELRDPETIFQSVARILRDETQWRFGKQPLATVRLQLSQLEGRLHAWARREADLREDGWETIHTEWEPEPLIMKDFRLHGRLDRVDRRVRDGAEQIRVLDYKSGDAPMRPGKAYQRKAKRWNDLQLPIYRRIAANHWKGAEVEVGWFNLPRAADETGFVLADWTDDELKQADEAIAAAVKGIRAGEFAELGRPDRKYLSPALLALLGEAPSLDDEEEDEAGEEGESQ